MIKLENINFGYGKKNLIFNDLSLSLSAGHIYGLLGKNGAGKTTLLKIMSGLRFAQSGTATTVGCYAPYRNSEMLEQIYFLAEEMYVPSLTISEYLKAYAPFYPNFNYEQFDHYLEQFEITSKNDKLVKLSHGQKKKVLISFALATNTPILFMDEPTNGLDIPSKSIFRKVMSMAADENRLVVISTHQVRDLHSLIDSVVIIDGGKILMNESTDVITEKLAFQVVDSVSDEQNVLYSEENIRGSLVVAENKDHLETKLDIELLFNATIQNKERIKEIFQR